MKARAYAGGCEFHETVIVKILRGPFETIRSCHLMPSYILREKKERGKNS